MRNKHFFLRVDQVVGTGHVDSFGFFEHLFFYFFGDVDVVVLPPLLLLVVESVAVVVTTVGPSFVNEQGVEVVGSAIDGGVGLFYFFVNDLNFVPVILDPFLKVVLVFPQQGQEGRLYFLAELRNVERVVWLILNFHLLVLLIQEAFSLPQQLNQVQLFLTVLADALQSSQVLLLVPPQIPDRLLDLQRLLLVLLQEGVDVENGGEVEEVVDLLQHLAGLVVDHPVDLEEESLGRFFNPRVLLHSNHLSLLVPVIVDMRYSNLFAGFVELAVLDVHKQQVEELLLTLVYLN